MKAYRREFIKKALAAGTFLTGAGSFMAACSGIRRGDLNASETAEKSIIGMDERRLKILTYASLAPSGHNSQPWFVNVLEPNRWIIGLDPARRLPMVDPENREALLSIGAFAENLVLSAGTLGLRAEMRIMARTCFDTEIMEVLLTESKPEAFPLERIIRRRTVKHGFLPGEIRKEDVDALSVDLKDRLFYFPRGNAHARCIEERAVENFRIQANRDDAQKELVQWIRLRAADAIKHRDGLTTEGMEITGFKGWLVRSFFNPEDFFKPDARRQGIEMTQTLAREGGGWFILTSRGNTVADWIDTGRRFEHLALMSRERRIALHPMTQILEETSGREQIAAAHEAAVIPQFVLRVGYLADYPEPVSLRRPPGWFVKPL